MWLQLLFKGGKPGEARGGREAITNQYVASLATYLVIRLLYHHCTSVCYIMIVK